MQYKASVICSFTHTLCWKGLLFSGRLCGLHVQVSRFSPWHLQEEWQVAELGHTLPFGEPLPLGKDDGPWLSMRH